IILLSGSPCSFKILGIQLSFAMWSFSSSVYPETYITSILSKRGAGKVSTVLAVVINNTFERSKGKSR
ncbi:hypothetical protein V7D15_13940, partial [Thermoanaerobacter thermohydrosulfuricus]